MNVCERETVCRGKSLQDLVESKVGESPTHGDAGKLRNVVLERMAGYAGEIPASEPLASAKRLRGSLG